MSTQNVNTLDAWVASADVFDVLLDVTGNLWVRTGEVWRYVADAGLTDCDERKILPDEFAPYAPLDALSAAVVMRGLG